MSAVPYSMETSQEGSAVRRLGLTLLFVAFLYPVSSPDGISVNYSFVLLPLLRIMLGGKVRSPGVTFLAAMAVYSAIFFIAATYQIEQASDLGRRATSFLVYMSIFAFTFTRIDRDMVASFKDAVVVISIWFSLVSAYLLFSQGGASLGFEAKDVVGSQRFGFIYVLATWIVFLDARYRSVNALFRFGLLLVLATGLLLTFSRSAIVALLGTFALFVLVPRKLSIARIKASAVLKILATALMLSVLIAVLYRLFPFVFDFFGVRLFEFLGNSNAVQDNLLDQNTSEGTRVFIITQVMDYVSRNPVTGAGFLGVWVLPAGVGSAHNQLLDVLFRTGVTGLLVYAYLLFEVLRYCYRGDSPLFWGLVGVLMYGLFHETFKESHGAFILAFMFGLLAESWRVGRQVREERPESGRTGPP